MPKLRNGSKVGFEPGLSRLRVRHSTTELPRSIFATENGEDDERKYAIKLALLRNDGHHDKRDA